MNSPLENRAPIAREASFRHLSGVKVQAGASYDIQDVLRNARIEWQPARDVRMRGVVLSAPHEGFDLHTSDIAEQVHDSLGTALLTAHDFRDLGRGWWFNVNRPTEQVVEEGRAGLKEAVTTNAQLVYDLYRENLYRAKGSEDPCRLLVEVHMRDPRVPVVEVATTGFTVAQLHTIQKVLSLISARHLGEPVQHEILGLLGEDRMYIRADTGKPQRFYYTAKRAQRFGSLNPALSSRSLHIELPPDITHSKTDRAAYAKALSCVVSWVAQLS